MIEHGDDVFDDRWCCGCRSRLRRSRPDPSFARLARRAWTSWYLSRRRRARVIFRYRRIRMDAERLVGSLRPLGVDGVRLSRSGIPATWRTDRSSSGGGRAGIALVLNALPSRATSGAGSRPPTGAAANTGTWSSRTGRTGNTGRRPSSTRSCRRHRLRARRRVDHIEQRRKRIAEAEAATATVADIEHARELVVERAP